MKKEDFLKLLNEVKLLLLKKEYSLVISIVTNAMQKAPEAMDLYKLRADAYLGSEAYLTALADYKKIENAGVANDDILIRIAACYFRLNDQSNFQKSINSFAKKDPDAQAKLEKVFGAPLVQKMLDGSKTGQVKKNQMLDTNGSSFDASLYRRLYADLAELTADQLAEHFHTYGKSEGRISNRADLKREINRLEKDAPHWFDHISYANLNKDLKELHKSALSDVERKYILLKHYVEWGVGEKRRFDFPLTHIESIIANREHTSIDYNYNDIDYFIESNRVFNLNSTRPEFSIIIPVFNRFDLLLPCLASLESQVDKNFEVILIDNNSTDKNKNLFYSKINCKKIFNKHNLHYLRACNQGAKVAHGKHLIFANSDISLGPDAVSRTSLFIKNSPNYGVLGARLVNFDGFIQEVGAVIFKDGSTRGVGRGFQSLPVWLSYSRNVDYVSGCYLVTPKALFRSLGGFDEALNPAYYEDVDYCVRATKAGYSVSVDPRIVVNHHEYASQKSTGEGSELQKINRAKFIAKHKKFIANKFEPREFHELKISCVSNFQKNTKKVLIIDDCVPLHSNGSGYGRAEDILDLFCRAGCFVTHISTSVEKNKGIKKPLEKFANVEFISSFSDSEIEHMLTKRAGFYDVAFISRRHNVEKYHNLFRSTIDAKKIIFDIESFFSVRDFISRAGPGFDFIDYESYLNSDEFRSEVSLYSDADAVTFASNLELLCFDKFNKNNLDLIELGHHFSIEKNITDFGKREGVIFFGAVYGDNSPNADSFNLLVNEIIPSLRKSAFKKVKFYLAGQVKNEKIKTMILNYCEKDPYTKFLGAVDDIDHWCSNVRLMVSPTRIAAGIPHKVGQAARNGLPILISNLLSQQLAEIKYFYTCNSSADFVDGILEVYNNPSIWSRLSKSSLKYVQDECSSEKYVDAINKMLKN